MRKKQTMLKDPYEMYLVVFQQQMETKEIPVHNESKFKHYNTSDNKQINNEQATLAVILGISHADYAKDHPTEMSVEPKVPWSFEKFRDYLTKIFSGYKNASRE